MVNESDLAWTVHAHPGLKSRVEAIVMKDRWLRTGDPTAPIPLEDIMWAVASNVTIIEKVKDALAAAAPEDQTNVDRAIVSGVEDGDLEYVVLSEALPRLSQTSDDGSGEQPDDPEA